MKLKLRKSRSNIVRIFSIPCKLMFDIIQHTEQYKYMFTLISNSYSILINCTHMFKPIFDLRKCDRVGR